MTMLENVITIDGFSSSGKTSVAQRIAQRHAYAFFDSGSLYRAFCFYLGQHQVELIPRQVYLALQNFHPAILKDGSIILDDLDISDQLHTPKIDAVVSLIGSAYFVRKKIKIIQREFCETHQGKVVMTGRDIGVEIVPESKYKFFLTASAQERAIRRKKQFDEQGLTLSTQEIEQELLSRDEKDQDRKVSPMRPAQEGVVIDSTNLSFEEVVKQIETQIKLKKTSIEGPLYHSKER